MDSHPRSLICDQCGGKMEMERYEENDRRFRKYYCLECGFEQLFKARREEKKFWEGSSRLSMLVMMILGELLILIFGYDVEGKKKGKQ